MEIFNNSNLWHFIMISIKWGLIWLLRVLSRVIEILVIVTTIIAVVRKIISRTRIGCNSWTALLKSKVKCKILIHSHSKIKIIVLYSIISNKLPLFFNTVQDHRVVK